jgi:hypothetical protein
MAKPRDLAILLALAAAAYSGDAKAEVAQDMKELADLLKEHGKPEFSANIYPRSTMIKYCSGDREIKCNLSYELKFNDKGKKFTLLYIDWINPETGERDGAVNQDDVIMIEISNSKKTKPDMPGHFHILFSDAGLDYKIRNNDYDYIEFRINKPSKDELALAEKVNELYPKKCFDTEYKGPSFAWWKSKKHKKKGTKQIKRMIMDQQKHYVGKALKHLRSRTSTQRNQ